MTSDAEVWKLQQEIPSDPSIGSGLIQPLLEAMTQFEWEDLDLFRVQLAYEEAITNAIRHGNQLSADKTVQVGMHVDGERLEIEIVDQGPGFDLSKVPDPRDEDRLECPGGRGVLLIHSVMNQVHYSDRGNRVQMIKIKGQRCKADDA